MWYMFHVLIGYDKVKELLSGPIGCHSFFYYNISNTGACIAIYLQTTGAFYKLTCAGLCKQKQACICITIVKCK